ncbi:uncharacterized protein LY89DRAFT_681042 [Mollisia scopiformis]|uniref:Uncharacterized protein n=1 Tax=Mollisia scopiformis TaxID=149040 RepID=A0A194XPB3_MOLSC|nr:uncharacterized protein LY89DRAFT_681042 [Mollisia scopiformis]KUJ21577.1 hypothetical protein LY89DRAFT_681042 [Mollisia scopiformis]
MAIMDFVQRFQSLQVQRDNSDELIKVGPSPVHVQATAHTFADRAILCYCLWEFVRDFDRIY